MENQQLKTYYTFPRHNAKHGIGLVNGEPMYIPEIKEPMNVPGIKVAILGTFYYQPPFTQNYDHYDWR
jgi:hypothetical protein